MAHRNFDDEYNYDAAEEHTFTLGGYDFRTKPVAPIGAFLNGGRGLLGAARFLRAVVLPEDRPNLERVFEMPDSSGNLLDAAPMLLAAAGDVIRTEKGSDPKAKAAALAALAEIVDKAVAPDEGTVLVSAHAVEEVADWLMEVTLGRPTNAASSSSNGAARTSNGSKATSPKRARASAT